jgi:ribosomal protein L11 methyltransferase
MDWIEVALNTDGESAEAIADLLHQYGYQGVAIEQLGIDGDAWEDDLVYLPARVIVRAYIPDDDQAAGLKARLEKGLGYLHQIRETVPQTPTYKMVEDEDWSEAWKVHYRPLRIGEHFYIRPEWIEEAPKPTDVEIILDPGSAFGTGTHPSTQLCLVGVEAQQPMPPRVLDLGCGSGILAIGAAKLGATDIWAIDTDELAVKATQHNATLNSVLDVMTVQQGSLQNVLDKPDYFDLILVNILAKIIIPMCAQGLGSIVKPGGIAVFSGIIDEQGDAVEAALRTTGLIPFQRRQMADWIAIEARRE